MTGMMTEAEGKEGKGESECEGWGGGGGGGGGRGERERDGRQRRTDYVPTRLDDVRRENMRGKRKQKHTTDTLRTHSAASDISKALFLSGQRLLVAPSLEDESRETWGPVCVFHSGDGRG